MELLKSSSESILSEGLVTGVLGRSAMGVCEVCFFRGGPSAGISWPSASEALRLRAVGGVVIGIISQSRLMTELAQAAARYSEDRKRSRDVGPRGSWCCWTQARQQQQDRQ